MSILLEALRKTEKNRKKVQVPTIHSGEQVRSGPEPLRTGWLVAMIAVALIVSGWVTWRQYRLPEGFYQPPVTLSTTQARTGGDRAAADRTRSENNTDESKPSPAQAIRPSDTSTPRQQRTPVETYQAPAASTPGLATAGSPSDRNPGGGETGASGTSKSGVENREPVSTASPPAASAAGASVKPVEPATPHIPEPIGYWELPDSVRSEVPEIRYSVLVYNEDPAQRFALIDGQRLGEGDSTRPGLVVEEIRRDGIVFSYRLYKFLVKR
ncbi:MAG: general secretion pathway protein GspB [Xanthomonadales bacterium]|nr:general secretion pathway protein GspB [Xanthomonadales bacterium]